jgi:diguanylate cyclase (GGDEF)-like protein
MEKPFALIVEDDRDIAALFRHVLDIAGYQTENVMDGREAVRRLNSTRPDIVLLDLSLPGVPGAKILQQMRADERLQGVPVVVITAHAHIADSLPVEPDLVLLKPVNLDQLSNLVQRLRTTPTSMGETPWDEATHLYNSAFFSVRLAYSLERARQIGTNRFGVMFVDLEPFASLERKLDAEQMSAFLREIAGHLKSSMRPTDTLARTGGGFFLTLIEDVPDDKIPARIAARIRLELGDYLTQKHAPGRLHAYVGVVLCDGGYESTQEILKDIEVARKLARTGKQDARYNREMLMGFRGTVYDAK